MADEPDDGSSPGERRDDTDEDVREEDVTAEAAADPDVDDATGTDAAGTDATAVDGEPSGADGTNEDEATTVDWEPAVGEPVDGEPVEGVDPAVGDDPGSIDDPDVTDDFDDPAVTDDFDDPAVTDDFDDPAVTDDPGPEADADVETAVSEADGGYAEAEAPVVPVDDPGPPDDFDDGGFLSGPETDEELPLADHVEEMIKRLAVVVLVAGVVSVALFHWGDNLITIIWYGVLPAGTTAQPHIFAPLELIVTQFKVASIAGLVVALPVLVYETYAFMRPGLYPHERRYYLAAIPTSLVLAVVGIAFAYFVVVPAVMTYFLFYSTGVANAALALGSTFNLILILMAYLAIVFQIPLFVMLAIMMGLTSRRWLADRRLLFWGAFAGVSFIATPDPTGVAPVVVAATMIVLFEGTLLLLKWTDRGPAAAAN